MQVEYELGRFVNVPDDVYYSSDFVLEEWLPPEEPVPINRSQALAERRRLYAEESDPLFMEWQYDKTREKELAWRAAVLSIKTRVPLK